MLTYTYTSIHLYVCAHIHMTYYIPSIACNMIYDRGGGGGKHGGDLRACLSTNSCQYDNINNMQPFFVYTNVSTTTATITTTTNNNNNNHDNW